MTFAPWRVGAWRWWMPAFLAGLVSAIALDGLSGADQAAIPGSSDAPVLRADTFARVARARRRSVVFLHTIARDSSIGTTSRGASPLGPQRPRVIEPIREGLGSGVVIDVAGLILTNAHVIDRADAIHLRTTEGDDIEVTIVGIDPELDVALVRAVDAAGLRPAPLGDSDRVKVGDWVLAIGNPFGLHHTVTAGILSAKARGIDGSGLEFVQTDAAINPGNSGGPLLDITGAVIGITTGILSERGENVGANFAVPINTVKAVLPQLRRGQVAHGWLGISTLGLSPSGARALGVDSGLLVDGLGDDGPAARAGIQIGDVLLGIVGPPWVPARDLHRHVRDAAPGTTIRVRVWRDGKTLELPVQIGSRPRE